MEELPKIEFPQLEKPKPFWKKRISLIFLIILVSFTFGGIGGIITGSYFYSQVWKYLKEFNVNIPEQKFIEREKVGEEKTYLPQTSQEEATIDVVKKTSPAVISIIVTKDIPIIYYENPLELFFESPKQRIEKREIGGGSGFLISEDGLILTNRHVVADEKADYTVFTNDGRKFTAKVLARDEFRDLAIIKIESGESFPVLKLGDSDKLQIGQTVIAIGNALGEFKNTVSVGVISGLGRRIVASGGGLVEVIEDVIQTDAAINRGNSGGPLLNLKGEVIGINVAMAEAAENIGFAIPVNKARRDIEQFKKIGKISNPYLGIWYWNINEELQKERNLPIDYGAWITSWKKDESGNWYKSTDPAVVPGSAAEKAGLKEDDIILEFAGEKITTENPLKKIIEKYNPGDKITLKVLRNGREKIIEVTLGEYPGH